MKRAHKTIARMAVIGLLFACMVASAADAWFCSDCGPAGTIAALSGGSLTGVSLPQGFSGDGKSAPEREHTAGACPTCLSPPVLTDSRIETFLIASHDAVPQVHIRLYSAVDTSVYRPPRVAF